MILKLSAYQAQLDAHGPDYYIPMLSTGKDQGNWQ